MFDFATQPVQVAEKLDTTSKMTKQTLIRRARQTSLVTPMLAEMHRRTKLKMKPGEVEGRLTFVVKKEDLLRLPLSDDTLLIRAALFRRIDGLGARMDDDSSYYDAVENDQGKVTVLVPLPSEYESGGWRCHAINGYGECLHPNKAGDDNCMACQTQKPKLKSEFDYLRIVAPAIRDESIEYVRIIRDSDADLTKCELAEKHASERLAIVAEKQSRVESDIIDPNSSDNGENDELMMNVELVQSGVWNRVHAKHVLSMMKSRKDKLSQKISEAKAQLAIMIQHSYQLAVLHAQKVVRGFLLRALIDRFRAEVTAFAQFSAAVEIQRVLRSALATKDATCRRKLKRNNMAITIQCLIRMRAAQNKRLRLWSIHVENIRIKSATKIQSI